jgi:hypothetical protein
MLRLVTGGSGSQRAGVETIRLLCGVDAALLLTVDEARGRARALEPL